VGASQQPEVSFCFAVGGPLSSLRAEAAGLDGLLDSVAQDRELLVFTDCLVLLVILYRWGQVDFWPDPEDIKHFDVIGSCLRKLRERTGETRLFKVKSHSGLLMNDRADALAERGRNSEEPPRWPAPRKLDPLCLSARPTIRDASTPFPDNNVSDKQLIRQAVIGVERIAGCMRDSTFSREFLRDARNCSVVLSVVAKMPDSTARLWMQTAMNQYPTAARLHKMFPEKYRSAACPWCRQAELGDSVILETLNHFLTVCPKFREARTEAHNKSWREILREITRAASTDWQFFEDKPIRDLNLLPHSEGSPPGNEQLDQQSATQVSNIHNLRPD